VANRAGTAVSHPHALLWGAIVAISLHAILATGLMLVPVYVGHRERIISFEIREPEPPLPPPEPEPPPPPPPIERAPRPRRPRLPPPPPMPNRETPPAEAAEEAAQPVFGVTEDSVVEGESPIAVPVGNTLMTEDRTPAKAASQPLPPAPPPPAFAPVDEDSVAEFPEVSVKPESVYPETARRMGIGGKVRLRVGIDRKGNVKTVRVIGKAGYGMDEEAARVVRLYKFKPARRADGTPVDFVITYNFTFRPPN